ncbi:hypothetical protein DP939_44185 [Spongiactinospora rosea]|uniref:O-acyltransferase WSD1 C-terminal domain-containing protein n=1 Tax=Spongiactinospora rosea TaxID=2248750 RepID=A0A366LE81_9ACTN|nr:WS/DGAT domain-containing protein [Spongiactinospora rosea]RBQ12195.1 hypothetical protein DP939_44185 [Spongiactinospora rosea]
MRTSTITLGATVNDIALTLTAAGVARLLYEAGEATTGRTIRVSVPVAARPDVRNSGGSPPTMVVLPLDEPDPRLFLDRASAQTRAAKAARSHHAPAPLFPTFAVRLMMRWLRRHGSERVSLYTTNVPGPASTLWLDRAPFVNVWPIAPVSYGLPLAVAVLTYAGTLTMTANASPDLRHLPAFVTGAEAAMATLARQAAS